MGKSSTIFNENESRLHEILVCDMMFVTIYKTLYIITVMPWLQHVMLCFHGNNQLVWRLMYIIHFNPYKCFLAEFKY